MKPIAIRKLLARVKSVLRKSIPKPHDAPKVLKYEGLTIDPGNFQILVDGQSVQFTKKEFDILVYLAKRPGRVVTRRILLDELWDENVVVIDRTVDVHIRKIREKIGEPYMNYIETIKGVGYRFKSEIG